MGTRFGGLFGGVRAVVGRYTLRPLAGVDREDSGG